MRKLRTKLLTPLTPDAAVIYKDHVIAWDDAGISYIRRYDPALDSDCEDRRDQLCLPGLIDVHTHLSQYRIRGAYEPSLLSWLERHVFPEEARSADPAYARSVADEFFQALFAAGTTTSVIYTAPFHEACEIAFASADAYGARAFIGLTMMDRNSPPELIQNTDYAYSRSVALYERWHGQNPRLDYIFTPRFALSCSAELMAKTARFISDRGAWLQTHLSENLQEIASVLKIFKASTYTQVYEQLGLLTPHSIFAHAIHLAGSELDLLAENNCRIAHCPDSNFFLKSGEFNYPAFEAKGIQIGLGSDVAAGTTLNMLYHAKIANFRQSVHSLKPQRLFYHLTLGNARLLGLDERIGSLEPGKEADLCFLKTPPIPDEDLLAALCFWGHEFPVTETVIAGRTVFSALEG
ncbi:MAG: guanine deaminase [Candidatus Cloacimonetes bacterium]|nr:guanine deaminase [Candidatus Cloacimonadota bacterium]